MSATDLISIERRNYWESFFSKEDPWQYGNQYETIKYEQTLKLLPPQPIPQALELACAEGHFTIQLASHVGQLTATDISPTALARAQRRCAGLSNVLFKPLDFIADELPSNLDLVVCSEALYYAGPEQLQAIAAKFAAALKLNGHLLMAHPSMVADEPRCTGFDWGHSFGARTISDIFTASRELALVKELRTPLYRIQLFQRRSAATSSRSPEVIVASHAAELPISVERSIIWGGAVMTRGEAEKCERTKDIPILMYHSVADDGPPELSPYRVSPARFKEQMHFLRRHGYHSISLDEWANCITSGDEIPGRPIAITFDDGYKNFFTHAAPLLEANDFRATIFVVTGKVGGTADWDTTSGAPLELMNWDELGDLQHRGFEIGSHMPSHLDLTSLSDDEIIRNGVEALTTLQQRLGRDATSIAFPWGKSDARVRAALARSGYRVGVSVTGGRSSLEDDLIYLPRIEIFGDDDIDTFALRIATRGDGVTHRRQKPMADHGRTMPSRKIVLEGTRHALTTEYRHLFAERLGALITSLMELEADFLAAVAPAELAQRRLVGLFTIPVTGASPQTVEPYKMIAPGVHFGFEATSSVSLTVRPKQSYASSPETCLNTVEIVFFGKSAFFTLEAFCSWAELATAQRYQLSFNAEPDRPVRCKATLRLPQKDGTYLDHVYASLTLTPGRCVYVSSGELKLPDLASAATDKGPMVLFFLDAEQDLRIRLDYINLYFG